MKRYVIKAGFESTIDLEKARSALLDIGVKNQDIDYISNPKSKGKGLKFGKETKGPILSLRFLVIGLIFGCVMYFLSYLENSGSGFWGTLFGVDIANFFLTTFSFGLLFLFVGYMIGRKFKVHTVTFQENDNNKENILMAVNTDIELLEETKEELLKKVNTVSLDVIDSRQEVEVGIRSQ